MQPPNQPYPPAPDQSGYAGVPQNVPMQQPVNPGAYAPQQTYVDPTQPVGYPAAPTPNPYAPVDASIPQGMPMQPAPDPSQMYGPPPAMPIAQAPTASQQPAPANVPEAAVAGAGKKTADTPPPRPKNTTQNTLLFSELRDNMVIMADGSFRAVIACQSINFDLMSSREREGVEYSYQNFINSLTHPVQILIRSQKVDIGPYIQRLIKIRKNQDNMLLGVLMDDYIDFIDILSEEANIMDKTFYVIIPYSPAGDLGNAKEKSKGIFAKMFGGGGGPTVTKIDKITYQKAKDEIKNRIDSVTSGLFAMGVHCTQLNTKQLGELYYSYYNPDTAIRQPLTNFESNTFTYVRKGDGQAERPNIAGGVNG